MNNTISTKVYVSRNGTSFSGGEYALHNCGGMSKWRLTLRTNGHFSETCLDPNYTGPRKPNFTEVEEWLLEKRGW